MLSLESSGILKQGNNEPLKKLTLSDKEMQQLTEKLTNLIGPISKHIIKASLKKSHTQDELHHMIAKKIPDLRLRQLFLNQQSK